MKQEYTLKGGGRRNVRSSTPDPDHEARTVVGELRAELAYPIALERAIAALPAEDRAQLRRSIRAARDSRVAAAALAATD